MSTLAKIFIIVNLFLTFGYVFLVAALLAQKNDYRERVLEQQKTAEEMIKQRQDAILMQKQEIATVKEEIVGKIDEIHKARMLSENYASHLRVLRDRKAEKEAKLPQLEGAKSALDQEISAKEDDNRALRKQKEELGEWLNQMQDEQRDAVDAKDAVQEEVRQAYQQVTEFAEQLNATQEDISKQTMKVGGGGMDYRDLRYIGGKDIDARVMAVSPGSNQIMLNVGENKELLEKTHLLVYRNGAYIAEVEVDQVFGEMSAARIISSAPGQKVQEGDSASTKLK